MFEVKNVPILVDEIEILKQLKEQVLLKTGREIFHKIKRSGNNIMVCCPIHNNGQEKKPSCGITTVRYGNKPPGTVHCFACGYIDSLDGMIAKCFGYDDVSYGTKWLLDNFVGGEGYQRPSLLNNLLLEERKKPIEKIDYISEEELASYRFTHSYLYKRKMTDEIIEKYDLGYQKEFIIYNDKQEIIGRDEVVTFPVRDINGKCLFISRRSIKGKNFYLPQNMEKPVYGIYELPKNCKQVIICESVFNALTCVVYGRPAVALFGTGTSSQIYQLNNLDCRSYILATDKDEAGRKARYKLKKALKSKLVHEFDYNSYPAHCNDINDMTLEEFNNLKIIF